MVVAKKVLAFGTFDLLHGGHLYYLSEAKKLGDTLTVIVARDATVRKMKGEAPVHSEQARLKMVAALKLVDKAVLGKKSGNFFEAVVEQKPDVIALGYDQWPVEKKLKEELAELNCFPRIVRLKPFSAREHKTSKIKERIRRSA